VSQRHTDEIVTGLARSLRPVRRIPRLRTIGLAVAAAALASMGLCLWLLGPRPDVVALQLSVPFVSLAAGLGLFACGGVLAALGASIPGRRRVTGLGLGLVALGLGAWLVAGLSLAPGAPAGRPLSAAWAQMTARCIGIALLVALPAAACLLPFVVRALPRRRALALASAGAAVAAAGALPVHLYCQGNDPLHVLVSHVVGPIALAALLAGTLWPRAERAGP